MLPIACLYKFPNRWLIILEWIALFSQNCFPSSLCFHLAFLMQLLTCRQEINCWPSLCLIFFFQTISSLAASRDTSASSFAIFKFVQSIGSFVGYLCVDSVSLHLQLLLLALVNMAATFIFLHSGITRHVHCNDSATL